MKIGHRERKSPTQAPAKHARGMKRLHDIARAMGSRSGLGPVRGQLRVRARSRYRLRSCRRTVEAWRRDYNVVQHHSGLDYRAPTEARQTWMTTLRIAAGLSR